MTFYLLGAALCFAVLFLLVSIGTLVSAALFRLVSARLDRVHQTRLPAVLFAIHLAPFLIALGVVVGLVLPAFVELEPPSTGEALNPLLALGAILGAGILLIILARLLKTLIATSRQQHQWLREAQPLHGNDLPVFVLPSRATLMAVTGLFRPRVFVSEPIVSTLSNQELAAALSHEFAHVQARDNFKLLLLRITQLPGWFGGVSHLKRWITASEVLADRAAIAGGTSPYHLASALVKVARLGTGAESLPAIAASHLVPDYAESVVASRVLQLKKIMEEPATSSTAPVLNKSAGATKWLVAASVIGAYLLSLNSLLPHIHEGLEWLVR